MLNLTNGRSRYGARCCCWWCALILTLLGIYLVLHCGDAVAALPGDSGGASLAASPASKAGSPVSPAVSSAPSFRQDIVPIFTRFGCNAGNCHGKLAGQNGFRLSLRGYAPEWDHEWITKELNGR